MKKELQGLYDLCISNGIAESDLKPYFATIESNLKTKRYGLVWEEQFEDIAADLKNKFPILVEREDLSIKADPNGLTNCLIEGDNYESLTFLKNSGVKVDCIYIDPPYNTGNQDFVYNDKYIDSEDTWRHSSWLSFMDKRLKLAKELLTDAGVIFISIDDNEQAQLKLLCDSVFGGGNFIEEFLWNKSSGGSSLSKFVRSDFEYILCYAKNKALINYSFKGEYRDSIGDSALINKPNKYNSLTFPKGSITISKGIISEITPFKTNDFELHNTLSVVDGLNANDVIISAKWKWTQKTLNAELALGTKILAKSNNLRLRYLRDLSDVNNVKPKKSITISDGVGYTSSGSFEVSKILADSSEFSYPKPVSLIKYLVDMVTHTNKRAVILDFFAGSGTTGHAVLDLNKEDGGNRKFILCTNNEVSNLKEIDYLKTIGKLIGDSKKELTNSYNDYKVKDEFAFFKESEEYATLGICRSVTYERLKRVINGYTTPKGEVVTGIPASLKYYKVTNIDSDINQMEIEDIVISNIVPFVQFKHNVWSQETVAEDLIELTNDSESVFIYSNTLYLCDGFYESINSSVKPTTLYIYDGLFEFLDEERLVNVNILSITNEFYKN